MTKFGMLMSNGTVMSLTLAFDRETARRCADSWNRAQDREAIAKLVMPRAFIPGPRCVALIVAEMKAA